MKSQLMERLILAIISFFFITAVASHAATITSEIYWKTVLGSTPMPDSIKHILPQSDKAESKGVAKIYKKSPKQVASMFFMEKDLQAGLKLNVRFTKPIDDESSIIAFLPRSVAESIPFTTKKLPQILKRFSVKPDSADAKLMNHTLFACAYKDGEDKYCATSLESMIDYATSRFGKNVKILTTETPKGSKAPYTVVEVKELGVTGASGELLVIDCHKSNYPYAVFYCHMPDATKPYSLELVDANGNNFRAIITCHVTAWRPIWLAFDVAKAKGRICHFLDTDDIVWVRP